MMMEEDPEDKEEKKGTSHPHPKFHQDVGDGEEEGEEDSDVSAGSSMMMIMIPTTVEMGDPGGDEEGLKITEGEEEDWDSKRKRRNERRRVLGIKKKEDDKKRTLDKVLKKPLVMGVGNKPSLSSSSKSTTSSRIKYLITGEMRTVSFPVGVGVPYYKKGECEEGLLRSSFNDKGSSSPNTTTGPLFCGVEGCDNPKKYSCSRTHVPLCSLRCYKKNLELSKGCGGGQIISC